jgi:excisionase family DNA binding protein
MLLSCCMGIDKSHGIVDRLRMNEEAPFEGAGTPSSHWVRRWAEHLDVLIGSLPPGAQVTLSFSTPVMPAPMSEFMSSSATMSKPTDATPELLSAEEVATRLRVKTNTVQKWCREGRFDGALSMGQAGWRIPVASVDAFLARTAERAARKRKRSDTPPPHPVTNPPARAPDFDLSHLNEWRAVGAKNEAK